jgi:hypothetical protein
LDSSEHFQIEHELNEEAKRNESGNNVWWIVLVIAASWAIAFGSVYLVIKERPDLVPMCILNPILRCTGQNQGGDQLINEDA